MEPAVPYSDLPSDLIHEILSRLPVKSLLRFRCVSKPWLALVDDNADFTRSHLSNFKNNSDGTRFFVVKSTGECVLMCSPGFELVLETPICFSNRDWSMVSSLDGLILLQSPSNEFGRFADLKMWNPSIRKLLQIPPLPAPNVSISIPRGDNNISFGYDQVAKSYKLVKLIKANNDTLHSVAIYVLGENSWRIIDKVSNWHWGLDCLNTFCVAVYSRSRLYFLARNEAVSRNADLYTGWDLVWFDLSNEVFSSCSIPYCYWLALVSGEGGPSLVAFDLYSDEIYAWVLDVESMCWTKTQLNSFGYSDFFHIKKNGDVLMLRNYDDCILADDIVSHVSCYIESLIIHK